MEPIIVVAQMRSRYYLPLLLLLLLYFLRTAGLAGLNSCSYHLLSVNSIALFPSEFGIFKSSDKCNAGLSRVYWLYVSNRGRKEGNRVDWQKMIRAWVQFNRSSSENKRQKLEVGGYAEVQRYVLRTTSSLLVLVLVNREMSWYN